MKKYIILILLIVIVGILAYKNYNKTTDNIKPELKQTRILENKEEINKQTFQSQQETDINEIDQSNNITQNISQSYEEMETFENTEKNSETSYQNTFSQNNTYEDECHQTTTPEKIIKNYRKTWENPSKANPISEIESQLKKRYPKLKKLLFDYYTCEATTSSNPQNCYKLSKILYENFDPVNGNKNELGCLHKSVILQGTLFFSGKLDNYIYCKNFYNDAFYDIKNYISEKEFCSTKIEEMLTLCKKLPDKYKDDCMLFSTEKCQINDEYCKTFWKYYKYFKSNIGTLTPNETNFLQNNILSKPYCKQIYNEVVNEYCSIRKQYDEFLFQKKVQKEQEKINKEIRKHKKEGGK